MHIERPDGSRLIVFSDLDQTLLDGRNYSHAKALPGLALLEDQDIPLVLCTSKTRPEVEFHRYRLDNRHPFVVENGGAVHIPIDYFGFDFDHDRRTADGFVLELGVPYRVLVEALAQLKSKTGLPLRGFSDMTLVYEPGVAMDFGDVELTVPEGETCFEDIVHGEMRFGNEDIDDLVGPELSSGRNGHF